MKIKELFEGARQEFDPFRKSNSGTPMSNSEKIKFHQDKLDGLNANAPKSHRLYHERWISKLKKQVVPEGLKFESRAKELDDETL